VATAHQIHAFAHEGLRVGLVKRDQHLIDRNVRRLGLARNLAQRVAALDLIRSGRFWFTDQRFRRHWRRNRRRFGNHRGGRRDCRYRLRGLVLGRIEKERVLPHQSAGAPLQFEQQLHERLVDRLAGAQAQHRPPVAPLDRHADAEQHRIEFDPRHAERFGRGDPGGKPIGLTRLKGYHLDFGPQRLAQCRLHRQPPQPGGMCDQRKQQACCQRKPDCGDHSKHWLHPESFFWDWEP